MADRKRAYTVFCGSEEVYRCKALSDKEAIDDFEGTLPEGTTLDVFAAERGMTYDDITARPE